MTEKNDKKYEWVGDVDSYKEPEGVNPLYIGYGMDGPKGYSRNLDTIHTL